MISNLAEWVVRTAMLVLAGLVTLSILGSIAAVSNQAPPPGLPTTAGRPVLAPAPEASTQPAPQPETSPPDAAWPAEEPQASPGTDTGETATVPAAPEPPNPERWLEAIAYALLAIAGLLALLLILVWRGVSALARIADRADLGQHRA